MSAATAQSQLQRAIARHQRGDLAGAATVYASVRQDNPRIPDAWHLSGLIAFQQGAMADAERLIQKALDLSPEQPDYLSNLTAVLLARDRPEEAEVAASSASRSGTGQNKSLKHLATAVARQGRSAEGIAILQQLIAQDPLDAVAVYSVGSMK